ncbi:serine/threonine-protein kinase [Actinomadura sediminis]|uniref:Serine/threonine-protein kinase n=1 Tax=Actinomadura sediminis TaxID=1038904 RepID=A0ABW3F1Q3_9ACTN
MIDGREGCAVEALGPEDPRDVGAYRLIARLGAGGMGRVFLGRSARGRMVAVKLVHPELARDPEFRRRFRHEVAAARKVGGEWTAAVLDADTESGAPWVATAYVPGPSLREVVDAHGPLPEASVRALADGLARALRAVHGHDLIHRDVKPTNVLVTIDGPRLIDFGIARSGDGDVATRTGVLVGSPGFMSPEQVRGTPLTPASDVFSLGAVLAFAATGRPPFDGAADVRLYRLVFEAPDLDGVDGPVRDLIERCLAKEADARPALDELVGDPPAGTWLPAAVVADLGRHAARLLDVEDPHAEPRAEPRAPIAPTLAAPPALSGPATTPPPGPPPGVFPGPPPGRTGPGAPARSRVPLYLGSSAAAAVAVVVTALVFILAQGDGRGGDALAGGRSGDLTPSGTVTGKSATGGTAPDEPGAVPRELLGTWEGGTASATSRIRRFTVAQGEVGDPVVTLRSVGEDFMCEYEGRLLYGGSTVGLDVRRTRSFPAGCVQRTEITLAREGERVRWRDGDVSGVLVPARHGDIPERYRGTWEGTVGRPTVDEPDPPRKRFELTAGAVGTEAVKITVSRAGASPCEAMATLLSAEDEILVYSSRLLTRTSTCNLAGLQKLTPRPDGTLFWEVPESGQAGALRRA